MRIKRCFIGTLWIAATLAVARSTSMGQSLTGAGNRPEIAANFEYIHSNAPAGGCGCFNMHGGGVTFALPVHNGPIALVADAASGVSTDIGSGGYTLILSTFTAGVRYRPYLAVSRLRPFAQATAGVAHASQSLVLGSSTSNAEATLAVDLGGGVDLDVNRRFSIRLIQAGYLVTTFDNGTNNRQNNLRLDAGIVLHF